MKKSDFKQAPFEKLGDLTITEWVLAGQHFPKADIYLNKHTKECYQVCEGAGFYRKTEKPADSHEALPYGKWLKLN